MFILISIFIFGLIIAVHELGHFLAARAFGVGVPEFAIGMGPVLLKKQGKETKYTLRAIPLGGFCALDGDDNEAAGEKSLMAKPLWQRLIIFVSGSAMNIGMGFLVIVILVSTFGFLPTTTLSGFAPGFPLEGEGGFQVGDRFHSIGGNRVYQNNNIALLLSLETGDTIDVVVIRDGARVELNNLPLQRQVFEGSATPRFGFYFAGIENPGLGDRLAFSGNMTRDFLRQLPLTIRMFTTGQAGIEDVSSVVGIVDIMHQAGAAAETAGDAIQRLALMTAIITIGVATINLLPIPGLDGGRIFLMLVGWGIEKLFRRKLNPKYEAYINAMGLVLLFGFMIFIVFQDIIQIAAR